MEGKIEERRTVKRRKQMKERNVRRNKKESRYTAIKNKKGGVEAEIIGKLQNEAAKNYYILF